MDASLEGKAAIVTGASHAVGAAIAARLVEAGARVMLSGGDEARLRAGADDLPDKPGAVVRFASDLSQKFGVNNLIAATLDAFERIDILITTAIEVESDDVLEMSVESLDRVLAANLRAAFLVSQAVAQRMVAQSEGAGEGEPGGAIVHVTGLSGRMASPEMAAYAVACAGIDQLTRAQAVRLGKHGVRVNGVAPGGLMTDALRKEMGETPSLRGELIAGAPMGRIGEPGEVADAALFLASDRASFINGGILVVDGGRSAQLWRPSSQG